MPFLDILVVFWLDIDQISWERYLQNDGLAFLPLAWRFMTFWFRCAQKSKFWDSFWMRKWPTSLAFWFLIFFFAFSFFSFSFPFVAVIDLLLGLLAVKKLLRKHHQDGQLLPGVAKCCGRKFCSEFYTQLFEHFCTYLRIHLADNSDLGIIGKIFSSCRSWV